ncbi:hypothetical protein M0P98_06505 [bacterium]|nr:hypothetical protein [bacterium]
MKKIIYPLIFITLLLSGCVKTIKEEIKEPLPYSGPVDIQLHIKLDRLYVKSMSEDDPVWKILMGPFGTTKVYIIGSATEAVKGKGTTTSFKREINWGDNSFDVKSHTGSEINFQIQVIGKRTGSKDVGSITIRNNPKQTIIIEFNESGSSIK